MTSLAVTPLGLGGLSLVSRNVRIDERGSFARLFDADELAAAGWRWPVAQVNHSTTREPGTVRGLHYQLAPAADAKLVSCVTGAVWDVAVDLRRGSPTLLHWHGQRLSADEGTAMLIPPGFAHGFQALTQEATLVYCHSAQYTPDAERGLHPLDPRLGVSWPRPSVNLSDRDLGFEFLADDFGGIAQ